MDQLSTGSGIVPKRTKETKAVAAKAAVVAVVAVAATRVAEAVVGTRTATPQDVTCEWWTKKKKSR